MTWLIAEDVEPAELEALRGVVTSWPAQSRLRTALVECLHAVDGGSDVVVAPVDDELTPNQASQVLGMSRPHLYKLLDDGVIPSHRVGRDRRLRLTDVVEYRDRRELARRELAETFAHAERNANQLTAQLAGVDEETARELGF